MIDEKKLMKKLRKYEEVWRHDYETDREDGDTEIYTADHVANAYEKVIEIVEDMPKVGNWIPCSEKLPDDLETVTVTWVNREPMGYYEDIKDKPFVDAAMRFKGKWYWWSATLEDYLLEYGEWEVDSVDDAIEITAWQPLPEPWEGEEQNDTTRD